MIYTREQLNKIRDGKSPMQFQQHLQRLMDEASKGTTLTLAEESFLCSVVKGLRKENSMELAFDIKNLNYCKNYRFRNTYLLYYLDVNGYNKVMDAFGEIPATKKKEDVEYLHREHQDWLKIIDNKQNQDNLLGYISKETGQQLKALRKYCQEKFLGSRYQDSLKKSFVLYSKYIYQVVKEYYEEQSFTEQSIIINSESVFINPYTYVHIVFRHYSQAIKQYQNKSYHQDMSIDYANLPTTLYKILECYRDNIYSSNFNKQFIFFKLNGVDYAMWFKKITRYLKGNLKQDYLRLETFYPIVEDRDKKKIASMTLMTTNCDVAFYIP